MPQLSLLWLLRPWLLRLLLLLLLKGIRPGFHGSEGKADAAAATVAIGEAVRIAGRRRQMIHFRRSFEGLSRKKVRERIFCKRLICLIRKLDR